MDKTTTISLTVYFDEQFYIGIFEKQCGRKLSVCRYVFGAEPKDSEVYELVLHKWRYLKFSPHVKAVQKTLSTKNPKVLQRKIKAMVEKNKGIGTKAQQAIKLQTEQRKIERKSYNKAQRDADSQLQYELKQQKKKEKHNGH